jgi:hypothetical protein
VAIAFILTFYSQIIKSFYTQQQHCYVYLKTLYPDGIRTRVFLFLRRMQRQGMALQIMYTFLKHFLVRKFKM